MSFRILYDYDVWDAATVTASSERTTDMVAENVLDNNPSLPWQSSGVATPQTLTFQLAAETNLTVIHIENHNFTADATVTFKGHTADSWGTPDFEQELTIATDADGVVYKRLTYYFDESFDYWQLEVDDSENPDGITSIGRVIAGQYYAPPRNINDGFAWVFDDSSLVDDVPGAWTEASEQDTFRQLICEFSEVDRTQRDKFEAIFRKVGKHKPVVVSINPTTYPTKDSGYCRIITSWQMVNVVLERYNAVRMVFGEKVR